MRAVTVRCLASFLAVRPFPAANLSAVDSVLVSVTAACNLAIPEFLFGVRADSLQFRDAVNRVHGETESVRLVIDCQLHRCVDVALLLVTPYVKVPMVRAAVGETVNQPGITMEVEDDRLVDGKERIEIRVR